MLRALTCAALLARAAGWYPMDDHPEDEPSPTWLPHFDVCEACHGYVVNPATGEPTEIFVKCFEAVARACDSDHVDIYDFCPNWLEANLEPKDATMMEVVELENWKVKICEWA